MKLHKARQFSRMLESLNYILHHSHLSVSHTLRLCAIATHFQTLANELSRPIYRKLTALLDKNNLEHEFQKFLEKFERLHHNPSLKFRKNLESSSMLWTTPEKSIRFQKRMECSREARNISKMSGDFQRVGDDSPHIICPHTQKGEEKKKELSNVIKVQVLVVSQILQSSSFVYDSFVYEPGSVRFQTSQDQVQVLDSLSKRAELEHYKARFGWFGKGPTGLREGSS